MKWIAVDIGMLVLICVIPANSSTFHTLFPLAMIAQLGWFAGVANAAIQLKAETGNLPVSERIKVVPFAIGLAAFGWVNMGGLAGIEAIAVGCVGVVCSATSKLLISRSKVAPVGPNPNSPF